MGIGIVDAHQHVWDLSAAHYSWLTPDLAVLDRTYTLAEAAPELRRRGVDRTVLVQAADSIEDTDHMLRVADAHPVVAGVVGWLPLADPPATSATLERWRAERRLVGARHLIHREADAKWLLRPTVLESLGLLAAEGLTFDVCAERNELLALIPVLAERWPDLTLVVDHLGKPPIRTGGWEPWAGLLAAAAEAPNVVAKVSGLNTAAGEDWRGDDFQPYVDHAITVFGPDRLLCGSDWPFARLAATSYRQVWDATVGTLSALGPADRQAILGRTAARVYGLDR